MRKYRCMCILLSLLLIATLALVGCQQVQSQADELIVYNWADYIYDYEEDFQEYYHDMTGRDITVTYVTFDTNETMLTRLMRGDSNVDVICPSEYAIEQLLTADMLLPINYYSDDSFVNSQYVDSNIVDKISDTFEGLQVNGKSVDITDYLVPYMYGTIGILYNLDIIEQEGLTAEDMYDSGWGALFNKDNSGNKLSDSIDKRIFMKDSIRDAYAATACYLKDIGALEGTPYADLSVTDLINTVDDDMIELVRDTLVEQKDVLYGYEVDFGKNDLIMGNAYLDLAWSGDAMYAIEEAEAMDIRLDYYVPQSSNIWFDGWVIPRSAVNVEPAKIFIDFLNSPYVASQNTMEIGYTPATNMQDILDDEEAMTVLLEGYNVYAPDYWTVEDDSEYEYDFVSVDEFVEYFFTDIRYPDIDSEGLGVMKHFGSQNTAVANMWESVRSLGISATSLLLYTILVCGVIIGGVYLAYYIDKRKKLYVKVGHKEQQDNQSEE